MQTNWLDFLKKYPSLSRVNLDLGNLNMLFNLPDDGLLKVSGIDAKKLLQGQLTCNLEEVSATESRMGAHCNPQGRIISLFRIFQFHDAYFLLMPRKMISISLNALKKYAIFYKTELSDASDTLIIMGCAGAIAKKITTTNTLSVLQTFSDFPRCFIIGELEAMKTTWEQLASESCILNMNAWKELGINNKIPTVYPETSGKFLPHDINLPALNAVSFEKGCFTGQEIITRMHYRGKLKNHLYLTGITSKFSPMPGDDILDEEHRAVGTVVDAYQEEYNNYRALIVVEESHAKNQHLILGRDNQAFFTIL